MTQHNTQTKSGAKVAMIAGLSVLLLAANADAKRAPRVQIGSDANTKSNAFIQPQAAELSGGDRDQTLQFGDALIGQNRGDVLVGRLGVDVLNGRRGNDVMIGGPEHFNPQNRDRAFGDRGDDIFIWSPGDGSDFFHGGPGMDAVVFGLLGEVEGGDVVFRVKTDQQAGEVDLDPSTNLPAVNVTDSPGFCPVIDKSSSAGARSELDALGLDHLVQFVIRGIRNAFETGAQENDNGLRVTLHLTDVEILVCRSEDGSEIEVLDLTQSPPARTTLDAIKRKKLRSLLSQIVF